jgi:hypothetical protein
MTALTPAQIAEAEALCAAATAGPWEVHRLNEKSGLKGISVAAGNIHLLSIIFQLDDTELALARFIAASRSLVPALIATVRQAEARAVAAEARIEALTEALKEIVTGTECEYGARCVDVNYPLARAALSAADPKE